MPIELRMAIMTGCELEHFYDQKTEKYTIKTKNPVSISTGKNGEITVYELSDGMKKIKAIFGIDMGKSV